jgi:hypothetical protein
VGSIAENLHGQACEHIARPDLDENASASVIHGFDFVGESNGTDEMFGQ